MSMNIYAKQGDLVVVTEQTKNSGYPYDSEQVAELLELNKPYKVVKTEVESFSTKVYLEGFVLSFNSVNFEDYSPLSTPAVDELNLDERAERFAKKWPMFKEDDIEVALIDGYIQGYTDSIHHNHASFVALVEGEIKHIQSVMETGDMGNNFLYHCEVKIATYTDLLNKIK